MARHKRPKSVRKARAIALAREEKIYSKTPHTFIFSRPGVGRLIKQLALDLREMFEPFTASRLHVNRRNVLKDFITIAGPLNVTHLMYLTHPNREKREQKRLRQLAKKKMKLNKSQQVDDYQDEQERSMNDVDVKMPTDATCFSTTGHSGVYLHLIRVPHGPSLTFSVCSYSLKRDIQTLIKRIFDSNQYRFPPLLVMTGFQSSNQSHVKIEPHLRLIVDMFQNLLPPLNVQKLKLSTVKRVLLISREIDPCTTDSSDSRPDKKEQDQNKLDDIIYIRHYHIRTENREISRALRRLGMGGKKLKISQRSGHMGIGPGGSGKPTGVPNLGNYTCMEDYLTKSGLLSESALSDALSDMEEVELPHNMNLNTQTFLGSDGNRKRKFNQPTTPSHGLKHLATSRKAIVRLTEIGPRLMLKLIKIEEGVNTGTVLFHRWQSRSLTEIAAQAERLRKREALRATRRAEHEARRLANEKAREVHRLACLEGMRRAAAETTSQNLEPPCPKSDNENGEGVKTEHKSTRILMNDKRKLKVGILDSKVTTVAKFRKLGKNKAHQKSLSTQNVEGHK